MILLLTLRASNSLDMCGLLNNIFLMGVQHTTKKLNMSAVQFLCQYLFYLANAIQVEYRK